MAIDLQATTASGEVLYNTGSTIDGITPSALVASATQSVNTQTGTTYTLVLTDANKIVTLSNASGITLTVPPNSSVAFPTTTVVQLLQLGAGQVTVAGGVGVTVDKCATFTLKLLEQYAEASLVKVGTDSWVLTGVLEAV
jgi:hypothetical protein